ncbi:MAG TPA: MCE family protein [Marmoricola sp.]|jgi:phospholipid/cholesterol/gamma-HCH transport system substrate-binding protein|nr:MCE family protein [Marmoricola sp.]
MSIRGSLIKLLVFAFVTVMLIALLTRTIQGFQDGGDPTYKAVFADATKVVVGDDVRLAGVTVGRVKAVQLTDDARAKVTFSLDPSIVLNSTSTAVIRFRNLIGERYVALTVPADGTRLPPGSTLPLSRTHPALDLTAVFNGFQPLFQGLDSQSINALSFSLVQALQGEGGTIASLLSSTGSLGTTIAHRDADIGELVDDLTTVLQTLNERSGPFNRLVTHLQSFTTGLAQDREVTIDALAGIDQLAKVTDTLLTQARPGLAGTIKGVQAIATQLDAGKKVLADKLGLLPVKLNALMRSAQYGSWFQFFDCGIGAQVDLLGKAPPLVIPPTGPSTDICGVG